MLQLIKHAATVLVIEIKRKEPAKCGYMYTHKMDDALGQQPYVPLTSINQ
jgi:hypothetical protein